MHVAGNLYSLLYEHGQLELKLYNKPVEFLYPVHTFTSDIKNTLQLLYMFY